MRSKCLILDTLMVELSSPFPSPMTVTLRFFEQPWNDERLTHVLLQWSSFKFSPDGTFLLLSTDCEAIFIVDSFQGDLKHIFTRPNPNKEMFEASWSPDSKYVFTGGKPRKEEKRRRKRERERGVCRIAHLQMTRSWWNYLHMEHWDGETNHCSERACWICSQRSI